jgi:ABC-type multidrug transport system fused ATPase/permease subunit
MKVLKPVIENLSLRERLLVGLSLFARLLIVTLDLLGMFLIGAVVSLVSGANISQNPYFGQLVTYLGQYGVVNSYAVLLALAIVFFIVKAVVSASLNKLVSIYVAGIELRTSTRVFTAILDSKLEELDKHSRQELVFTSTHAVNAATTKAIMVGSTIFGESVLMLAISIYLAVTDIGLFLSMLALFGVVAWVIKRFVNNSSIKAAYAMHGSNLQSQELVLGALSGFQQIANSPNKATLIMRFSSFRKIFASKSAEYQTISNLPRYITEVAILFGVAVLVAQRSIGDKGLASAGVIAVFLAGIFRIVSAMLPLQSALSGWKQIGFEASKAFELLADSRAHEARITRRHTHLARTDLAARLEVSNLSYKYVNSQSKAISGLSFKVKPGTFVAVVGPSGSGKSTLADLILGLREPTSGSVKIDGIHASDYVKQFPGEVAYVPQEPVLFQGSLRSNVSLNFGESQTGELEKVQNSLRLAGLEGSFLKKNPIEGELDPVSSSLSGGEVQRVALARALYFQPKLIVMDEATSALDSSAQSLIMRNVQTLIGDTTLLVIAHRTETIQSASQLVQIESSDCEAN